MTKRARTNTSKSPASASQDPPKEQSNAWWSKRDVNQEPTFQIPELGQIEAIQPGINMFRQRRLDNLFQPPAAFYSEQVCHLFFQNMTIDGTDSNIVNTSIDTFQVSITATDIAEALEIPYLCPDDLDDTFPAYPDPLPTVQDIVATMCEGRNTKGSTTTTTHSLLLIYLIFIDWVLKE